MSGIVGGIRVEFAVAHVGLMPGIFGFGGIVL
jgi:hypothetical protein